MPDLLCEKFPAVVSKMTSFNKFFEMFRNIIPDAMPRPPRPNKEKVTKSEIHEENVGPTDEPEEILIESDDEVSSEKKPKFKKSFFKPGKKEEKPRKGDKHSSSTVNTQATGNVINVVNSTNVRWGNDYYMGTTYMTPQNKFFGNVGDDDEMEEETVIKKCNDIELMLEAKTKPGHEYIDFISKNLGKNWQKFFLKLGYTKNKIETMVIDTEKYGVSEARYKLLLDWMNNEDDASLGRLATRLWEEGERQLVKKLALMYKANKN